uniref:Uncharacterized protein n=1 Tax=Mus musculus TaxID=10090 RepID=Q8CEH7_MOUSE|nr:unnamed protein product [Mus musculus]
MLEEVPGGQGRPRPAGPPRRRPTGRRRCAAGVRASGPRARGRPRPRGASCTWECHGVCDPREQFSTGAARTFPHYTNERPKIPNLPIFHFNTIYYIKKLTHQFQRRGAGSRKSSTI